MVNSLFSRLKLSQGIPELGILRKFLTQVLYFFLYLYLFSFLSPQNFSFAQEFIGTSNSVVAIIPRNFPPYYVIDENGRTAGFAIDIMNHIAKLAGLNVSYLVKNTWSEVDETLVKGEGDVIPNLGITEDRKKHFDFTRPVEVFPISIFVSRHDRTIRNEKNLAGKRIVVVKYNVGEKWAKEHHEVKGVLFEAVKEFVGTKEYKKLHEKWFGKPEHFWTTKKLIIFAGFFLLFVVAMVLTWRFIFMKKINRKLAATIDDLKKVENKLSAEKNLLSTIINNIPDLIYVKDAECRFILANPSTAEFVGASTPGELVGKTDYDFYSRDVAEILYNNELSVIQTGDIMIQKEEKLTDARGNERIISTTRIPLRDKENNIIGLVGVGRDITERVKTENKLREKEKQLQRSQRMEAIARLTSGIAHDFNNLLSVIIGYSDLLALKMKDKKNCIKEIEEIKNAGTKASSLINQLLTYSKKVEKPSELIDLNVLINGLGKILKRTLGEDIDISFSLEPNLWMFRADMSQIEQVLMNLVINARDAMPDGGKILIETKNVYLDNRYSETHVEVSPGQHVMLSITDTGKGIDSETQEHIFEPFFSTKGNGEGTGLGLYTVYNIVKHHGGHIWVYSEPGMGTCFKIYFPAVPADQGKTTVEESKNKEPAKTGTESILIIEDDDQVRRMASDILSSYGYNVLEATNPDEAFSIIEKYGVENISLFITDMVMPGMDGREFINKLREKNKCVKVLYMSGYTNEITLNHGGGQEIEHFIHKPFFIDDFVKKVRDILDKK